MDITKLGQTTESGMATESIERDLGIPNLVARILAARGIAGPEEAKAFLFPRLEDLSDPFLMPDMEKGVTRVIEAIIRKEAICLYGDYDADGVTSLALMMNFFRHLGITPLVYIPERKEGYGLHTEAIRKIQDKNKDEPVKLLISLDCGSTNIDEICFARSLGIDTIVIDHHEPGKMLPPALAVINPKREDSAFPTRDLAACGVAFFFLLALRRRMHNEGLLRSVVNMKRELDVVALGTVGDMAPLTKDNRIIVRHGMEVMREWQKPWYRAMLREKVVPDRRVDEYTLNFIIVPRINASGRVSTPYTALDFLRSENDGESMGLLRKLQDSNKKRQKIEKGIIEEIEGIIRREGLAGRNSIVLFKKGWDIGVLGIVAQKIMELYGKPSIIMTDVNGVWKGSGRGGDGMDLYGTIASLSGLLKKFGGHKYACGITINEENLLAFRDAFEASLRGYTHQTTREAHIDTDADFNELTPELMERIEQLSPFGVGNPRPVLRMRAALVSPAGNGRVKIVDQNKRSWYGYMAGRGNVAETANPSIAVSPLLKQEGGRTFINLNVKQILSW